MKPYQLKFSLLITEGRDSYSPPVAVKFDITENLPANVDAQQYVKRRMAEEVKRHFDALIEPIDNKTDEAKASEDPLAL